MFSLVMWNSSVMQVVNTSPHHISCRPLQPWTWPLSTGSPMHPYALHLPGLWTQESYELCTKQRNKTHHLITAQVYNELKGGINMDMIPVTEQTLQLSSTYIQFSGSETAEISTEIRPITLIKHFCSAFHS